MKALTKVYVYVGAVNHFKDNDVMPEYAIRKVKTIRNEKAINEKKASFGLLTFALDSQGISADVRDCFLGDTGKPMHKSFDFSIAHSHGIVAVAVGNVGIDAEPLESEKRTEKVLKRITREGEENINSLVLWTQKEAVFKCKGEEKGFLPHAVKTLDYQTKSVKFSFEEKSFIMSLAGKEKFDAEFFVAPSGEKLDYNEV